MCLYKSILDKYNKLIANKMYLIDRVQYYIFITLLQVLNCSIN